MKQSGFNPQARWDRNIPETKNSNTDNLELNEKIEVLAWFQNTKILPKTFIWKNKSYAIDNVNYYWQERSGSETINCFSVQSGPNTYQISFNNSSYFWKIDKIIN